MVAFLNAADIDEQRNELVAEITAIIETAKAEDRELSDDESARIDEIQGPDGKGGLLNKLDQDYDRKTAIENRKKEIVKNRVAAGDVPQPLEAQADAGDEMTNVVVPAKAKSVSTLKGFTDDRDAYASGQFLAAIAGNKWAKDWCEDHGFRNAMSEGTDSAGGYTVPTPLSNAIIRLVEMYGVFRQNARVVPMTADTLLVPRRTAGLTVYYPAENNAITPSDLTFAQATLTAQMYSQLALMSTQLNEDSAVSMADLVAQEFAYGFAVAEDTNGFTGDGTGTYASVTGLASALHANVTNTADSGEVTVASLDFGDYEATKALVSVLPGQRNKWYVNNTTYQTSMASLMNAAGGNTIATLESGTNGRSFLGDEVVISQVLPDDGADNIVAYYGDLSLAATLGNRRDVSISVLRELYAASNQIGFVATERPAITVHETGETAGQRPMACLKLAAS